MDVSKNPELEHLECEGNQLSGLDVSDNTNLRTLRCSDNQLSDLDVSNNEYLTRLSCAGNLINSLDVSFNTIMYELDCGGNQLTSLDISNNSSLVRENQNNGLLKLNDMPGLHRVCVWTVPFPPEGIEIDTSGSPNVYFTTDCSK